MLLVHDPLDLIQEVLQALHDLIVLDLRETTTGDTLKPTKIGPKPTKSKIWPT